MLRKAIKKGSATESRAIQCVQADVGTERGCRARVGFCAVWLLAAGDLVARNPVFSLARSSAARGCVDGLSVRRWHFRCWHLLALHQHPRFRSGAGVVGAVLNGRTRSDHGLLRRCAWLCGGALVAGAGCVALARRIAGSLDAARVGTRMVPVGFRLALPRLLADGCMACRVRADWWHASGLVDSAAWRRCTRDALVRLIA